MFDYFEYVQFPERENIKMIYPKYREKFNAERNPEKFYLNRYQLVNAYGTNNKITFSSIITGSYIYFYYYFVKNLSKATHSKCNYILMRNILPSSLVIFGTSMIVGDYLFKNSAAIRSHEIASEVIKKNLSQLQNNIIHQRLVEELRESE